MFGWFRKSVRKIGVFGIEVEFHPPTETVARDPAPQPRGGSGVEPTSGGATVAEPVEALPVSGEEMTFDAVIRAIRELHPDAVLGKTAEYGPYFDRARWLTNYQLHSSDPPWYCAVQPNGKTMWLYLGRGGKICCGDKE